MRFCVRISELEGGPTHNETTPMRAERNKQEAPDWTQPVVKAFCRRQTSIGHTPEVCWPTSVNEHQIWRYVVSVDEQQCLTCDQWWSEAP